MKRKRTNESNRRVAALQLDDSHIQLVILEESNNQSTIQVDSVKWRDQTALYSPESATALGKSLRQLSTKWQLTGLSVSLCISGDLCVTRVVAGRTEEVTSELKELENRCALYLSLGPGRKIVSHSVRKVDVRRDHGLAAVVNERLLVLLADAIHDSSIDVCSIEPSAVGLCRFVGQQQLDHDEPAIILNRTYNGHEICLSHDGYLYLNYRPAGNGSHEEIATLVGHHLARLRRYCRRIGFSNEVSLKTIYVAGERNETFAVTAAFRRDKFINATPIVRIIENDSWSCSDESIIPEYAALIGTCVHRLKSPSQADELSLLTDVQARMKLDWRQKVQPWLCTAVTALIVLVASKLVVWHKESFVSDLEEAARPFVVAQNQFEDRFRELGQAHAEIKELKTVAERLAQPDFDSVLTQITKCMRPSMRMKSIKIEEDVVILKGLADNEDDIFDFLLWLKRLPCLERSSLIGTSPISGSDRQSTAFEIECRLRSSEQADNSDKESHDEVI
jgi:hypothetical protein